MAAKINRIFRSSLVLSLIIFIIGLIIGILLIVGLNLFSFGEFFAFFYYGLINVGFLLVGYTLGRIYTKESSEIVPNKSRRNVAIFVVIETVLAIAVFDMITSAAVFIVMYTGFNIVTLIISGLLVYWVLGFGGKGWIKKYGTRFSNANN